MPCPVPESPKPLDPKALAGIKALFLDVDGVLTQGEIIYDGNGQEIKIFSVRDGLGIRLLMDAGIKVGIITGRASPALLARAGNLGMEHVWDGISDKAAAIERAARSLGVNESETAFVGDDLPDLPAFSRAGVSIAVADAHAAVIRAADMVTRDRGGQGAVREVCEAILEGMGRLDEMVRRFSHPS